MSIPFRDIPGKEGIEIRFPPDIASKIREKAFRERRSISEVGSELVVRSMGLDPAQYGIRVPASVG